MIFLRTVTCLVINEELYWIIAPFNQYNFICLTWHPIRKGCPYARAGTGLNPHTECEGVHLWQALSDAAIQVVGPLWEGQFKLLWGPEVPSPCDDTGTGKEKRQNVGEVRDVPGGCVFSETCESLPGNKSGETTARPPFMLYS